MRFVSLFIASLTLVFSLSEVATATQLQSATQKLASKAAQQTSTGSATSDFLYEMRNSGSGPLYNELLSFAQEKADDGLNSSLQVGRDATVAAGRVKTLRDKIAKFNSAIGTLLAVVDVSQKLASEDFEGAAWSAGFTVLGELTGKEAVVKGLGLTSTAPITAAIVALQIIKASYDAKENAIMSTNMETLYADVQRVTRVKGRQLGESPGPFPATAENIENVWNLLIRSQLDRDSFGNYVTQDLKEEWPQPGFFARLDANYFGLTTSNEENKQAQAEELEKNKADIRRYIASLLAGLNKSALQEEYRMVAVNSLKTLRQYFSQHGATLEAGLKNMEAASNRLPELLDFVSRLDARIRAAINYKSIDSLNALRSSIVMYVRDVLRWLPSQGVDATVDQLFKQLVTAHDQIVQELKKLRKEFEDKINEPELTVVEATDARSLYKKHYAVLLKPFDWDKVGGPPVVIDKMASVLAKGQFRTSFDKEKLPRGRVDYAGSIILAWKLENYAIACGGGTTGAVEAPPENEKEKTINGYYQKIQGQLRVVRNTGPGGPIIGEDWEVAYQMALATLSRLTQLSRIEYAEAAQVLKNMYGIYFEQAGKTFIRAKEIDSMLQRFGSQAFSPAFIGYARPTDNYFVGALPLTEKADPLGIEGIIASIDDQYSGFQLSKIEPLDSSYIEHAVRDYLARISYRAQQEIQRINLLFPRYLEKIDAACLDMERIGEDWDRMVNDAQPDIDDIRHFVDPEFMNYDLFDAWVTRRNKIAPWVNNYQQMNKVLDKKINTYIAEREDIIHYLSIVKQGLANWFQVGESKGVLRSTWGGDGVGKLSTGFNFEGALPFRMNTLYPHYLTKTEQSQIVNELRSLWNNGGLLKFSNTYAPWLQEIIDNYLQEFRQVYVLTEENFLVCEPSGGCYSKEITSKKIVAAENIVNSLSPGSKSFMDQYSALRKLITLSISFPEQPKKEQFDDIAAESLRAPLASRYVDMREQLREKLNQHYPLVEQQLVQKEQQRALEAEQRLPGLLVELSHRVSNAKKQMDKSESFTGKGESLLQLIDVLQKEREALYSEPYPTVNALSSAVRSEALRMQVGTVFQNLNVVSAALMNLIQTLKNRGSDATADIHVFYNDFKQAYEDRDESRLLSYLDDDWEAGDGTTLFDVEDYFHNMFSVFDEIQISISGLNVQSLGSGRYLINYDTSITGRIFADGLEHEEKSSVSEEVALDASGKVKIMRTPQGRFWYIK